ncbi:zinc finger protein 90-like [Bradysia coprophila]|uniref:zinc finger protein 90-like n=1 Tax=Bradysia coprophila TaxID=38358 RepID=UPI00187DC259|nr:zinc finger protein 90-like [Bradysia coprophila]
MSRKVFLGRTRAFGSDCLEEKVVQQEVTNQDDEMFINRMTGLNALWNDLLEQKKFSSTLRDQLQCSIKNQLILEATLNEREAQLQHEFDKIYATYKPMFSRNVEIGPVAANNATTISGYQQEHARQRQRCDDEKIRKVSSDDEHLHELPEHIRIPSEHVIQLESSPPKEQDQLLGKSSYTFVKDVPADVDKQSCPKCGKRYSLIRHFRIHTGEKLFKCADCDAAFNQPFTMAIHRRTHSDERHLQDIISAEDHFVGAYPQRSKAVQMQRVQRIVSPAIHFMDTSQSPL